VKLGFRKDAVVIRMFQGQTHASGPIREFEKEAGVPIANFLCSIVEGEAKRLGYKEVRIMRPENYRWYRNPVINAEVKKINRWRDLDKTVAEDVEWLSEKELQDISKEREEIQTVARGRIQKRMNRIAEGVAQRRNYKPLKYYFRKTLAD